MSVQLAVENVSAPSATRSTPWGRLMVVSSAVLLVASQFLAAIGVFVWALSGMLGLGTGPKLGVFLVLAGPALVWLVGFARAAWTAEAALGDQA